MLRFLRHLCHRPAIRFGLARDPRSPHRNTRFASFLAESNRSPRDFDRHDAFVRGRTFVRRALLVVSGGGALWFALESAKALSVF